MAIDEIKLRTEPRYWTAAVWESKPGGLMWKGYTPAVRVSWPKFVDRLMGLPRNTQTRSYYWDGKKWVLDVDAVIGNDGTLEIGKLERKSPLPPGRYWQDIFPKQDAAWTSWVVENANLDTTKPDPSKPVVIEKVERFRPDPLRDGSWLPEVLQPESAGRITGRMWVLFRVLRPVPWPSVDLGFPTVAEGDVQTSADTAQNPPGPSPAEEVGEALKGAAGAVLKPAAAVLGVWLGLKVLLSLRK